MSTVPDVSSAAPSPAAPAEAPLGSAADFQAPAPVRYDTDSLSPEERQRRFAKGEYPKKIETPAKPAASPAAKTSAAPKVETESDSEPDDEEKPDETPAERRKRNRGLREELIRANERARILEEQLAAKPKSAPAAQKESETPKSETSLKKPRINDYPNTPEGTAQWEDDLETYYDAKNDQRIEARFNREKTVAQVAKTTESFNAGLKAAKKRYPDYEEVAGKAIFSAAVLEVVRTHPKGEDYLYQLGLPENADIAKRIAKATDIDGLDYKSLQAASKKPEIRDRIMRAIGRAEAELEQLAAPPAEAPAPKPVPKTITSAPDPPRKVEGGGFVADPLAAAMKAKDWVTYNRLKTQQALEKKRSA